LSKKVIDDNDRLKAGTLPEDPFEGTAVADEVPRILTVRELLTGSGTRSRSRRRDVYGTTGHHKLDAITGGLRPGDCWLVGADTSWGKSSFAVMVIDENLRRGKQVLLVSSEDSEHTYGDRLMCRRSRVPAQSLRDRRLTAADQEAIARVESEARPDPVFIDARGKTVEWLAPQVKRAVREYGIEVVIFDYIGAFTCKIGQQDRRNAVTYTARVLTDVAKTAKPGGVCGILLSQLTIAEEGTEPGKYAFRDSKDLVQMAEIALVGFLAPKDSVEHGVRAGDRVMKVAKCKQGEAGKKVLMAWDPVVACFDAVHDEEARRLDQLTDGMRDWRSDDDDS
jgi:replicative DNA helicase